MKNLVLSVAILLSTVFHAVAWNQDVHRQINLEAINLFLRQMEDKEKYAQGPVTEALRQERLRGVAVTSEGLLQRDYTVAEDRLTMQRWIVMGGDWADEPHLYASVRHFYDPLALVETYLTDQFWAHGVYDSPGTNAKDWGLKHDDNPFTFWQALVHYKAAMEVAEDVPLPTSFIRRQHFRLLPLQPKDYEDQRGLYLAHAYRALGEAMHMLGDMTQPAHVRNDAHPIDEPIEGRVNSSHVRAAAADLILDDRVRPFLASAGGELQTPERLFHYLATFVNQFFYSADTIHDAPSNILPNNFDQANVYWGGQDIRRMALQTLLGEGVEQYRAPAGFEFLETIDAVDRGLATLMLQTYLHPLLKRIDGVKQGLAGAYPAPQFADLRARSVLVDGYLIRRAVTRYEGQGGVFDRVTVPMAQKRLSFHWFDHDQSIWNPFDEAGIKEMAGRLSRLGPYHIPNEFASKQARVLLPMAIYGCADLIELLYPTLELQTQFTDEGIKPGDAPGQEEYNRYEIGLAADMLHHQERDPAWSTYGLKIEYSGPATLVISQRGEPVREIGVHFRDGKLNRLSTPEGKYEREELELYASLGDQPLIPEEEFYRIEPGQALHLEIKAGTRHFKSEPWLYDATPIRVHIRGDREILYQLTQGATQTDHAFEAVAEPPGAYRFVWDFGDGSPVVTQDRGEGQNATVTHTYRNLRAGQRFVPAVKLFHPNGSLLAESAVSIQIEEAMEGTPIFGRYSGTLTTRYTNEDYILNKGLPYSHPSQLGDDLEHVQMMNEITSANNISRLQAIRSAFGREPFSLEFSMHIQDANRDHRFTDANGNRTQITTPLLITTRPTALTDWPQQFDTLAANSFSASGDAQSLYDETHRVRIWGTKAGNTMRGEWTIHVDENTLLHRGDFVAERRPQPGDPPVRGSRPPPQQEPPTQQRAQQLVNEGYALEQRGEAAAAIDKYREAVRLQPNDRVAQRIAGLQQELDKRQRAQQLVNEGYALEQRGETAAAVRKYQEAVALVPNEGISKRIETLRVRRAEPPTTQPRPSPKPTPAPPPPTAQPGESAEIAELRRKAEAGDPAAQSSLGLRYYEGDGIPQDITQAVAWFRRAAEQEDAVGQVRLGYMYLNGLGVPQDDRQGVEYVRRSAEQGRTGAQYLLGLLYERGQGVPQNYRQAVEWFQRAADQGHADAQFSAGTMYEDGRGVGQNYAQAALWYRRAADLGHASAQVSLAEMYEDGLGVGQDYQQAALWYRRAADQGNAIAQYNLGGMYEDGLGVEKELQQALKWYRRAAAGGDTEAAKAVERLTASSSPP